MSQAKIMTIALNRWKTQLKEHTENLPFDEKVAVWLAEVRRCENFRDGLAPAMTEHARNEILKLYGVRSSMSNLHYIVLSDDARLKCYARKSDYKRSAFEKWFNCDRRDACKSKGNNSIKAAAES